MLAAGCEAFLLFSVFVVVAKIRGSGGRVRAGEAIACDARRAALTRRPRAGQLCGEEDGTVQHQLRGRVSVVDLRELTGGGAPVPGGRPQRRARWRARQRCRAAAPLLI